VSLSNVRGHAMQADQIRAALFGDRPGSSYLFAGIDGIGKAHFARLVGKMLLCPEAEDDSCDQCKSCLQVEHDNHPDFHLVQAEEGKRFIKLEQIQELCAKYAMRPYGDRRIAVIRDADSMTQEAANALLKTLEEPPPWGLLILTTARSNALPETILSRCQTLRFGPLASEDISAILSERSEWPPEAVRFATAMADGSVGYAVELLENGGLELRDDLVGRLRKLRSQDNFEMTRWILDSAGGRGGNLESRREGLRLVLQLALRYYRDVWLRRFGAAPAALFHAERITDVEADAERLESHRVEKALELILEAWSQVNRNVNLNILLESVLFRLGLLVQEARH